MYFRVIYPQMIPYKVWFSIKIHSYSVKKQVITSNMVFCHSTLIHCIFQNRS